MPSPSSTRSRAPLPPALEPWRIISEKEYATLEGVSVDTIRRRTAKGEGPPRRQMSERRYGYLLSDILAARKTASADV
jgi:predicted DNA-binding transcriptional regulator AlpA